MLARLNLYYSLDFYLFDYAHRTYIAYIFAWVHDTKHSKNYGCIVEVWLHFHFSRCLVHGYDGHRPLLLSDFNDFIDYAQRACIVRMKRIISFD